MDKDKFIVDIIGDGGKRDREQDTCYAEHPSAYNDADQDPYRGDTKHSAEQLRLQHISVAGLENQREYDKPERVPGIDQHQDNGADDTADKGTEGRCQIGHSHNHGDQNGVRKACYHLEDEVGHADNQTVDQVAEDIPDQNRVAVEPEICHFPIALRGEQKLQQGDKPPDQAVFVQQEIDGKNEGDDAVHDVASDAAEGADQAVCRCGKGILQGAKQVCADAGKPLDHGVFSGGIGQQSLNEAPERFNISAQVFHQCHGAGGQLGNQSRNQEHQKRHHQDNGYGDSENMGQGFSFHTGEQLSLKQVGQRVQNIGDNQGDDHGLDKTEELPDSPENNIDVGQHQVEENRNAESDRVISPFFVFPVVIKFHQSFLPVPFSV